MDADDLYAKLAAALRRANDARAKSEAELERLRGSFDMLLDVLVQSEVLNDGQRRLVERVGQSAARPKVRLHQYVDKYALPDLGIDCEARLPLCHARCCAFLFELTTQDLDEGQVRWEVEEPYVIRHDRDGYCTHIERRTLGCNVYAHRPATCRQFDCREDQRVWIDFEQRIPAPMPDGLLPPPGSPGTGK
jgi:Fe-S-cluster containining protein